MKQLILIIFLISLALPAAGQFRDDDGHLVAVWQAPSNGNPLSHFELRYYVNINGVLDTIDVQTANLVDSTVQLPNVGDWAIFDIRAVSTFNDLSIWVQSDTALYAQRTGIDPPKGIAWQDD